MSPRGEFEIGCNLRPQKSLQKYKIKYFAFLHLIYQELDGDPARGGAGSIISGTTTLEFQDLSTAFPGSMPFTKTGNFNILISELSTVCTNPAAFESRQIWDFCPRLVFDLTWFDSTDWSQNTDQNRVLTNLAKWYSLNFPGFPDNYKEKTRCNELTYQSFRQLSCKVWNILFKEDGDWLHPCQSMCHPANLCYCYW